MRKRFKTFLSLLLVAVVALGAIGFGTTDAYAASHKWAMGGDFDDGIVYAGQPDIGFAVYDQNSRNDLTATVTAAKSSNTSVLQIRKHKYNSEYYYDTTALKVGTATVTLKFKLPEGGYKTIKKKITVKKYPNPMSSLKVLGKSVSLKKYKYTFEQKTSKTSVSVKAAVRNGWKISDAYGWIIKFRNGNPVKEKEVKITKSMITKGSSLKFPATYTDMYVNIFLEKNGEYLNYQITLHR